MHPPYEIILKHPPDFRVLYRFYDESEGGKKIIPSQGYRSDFWYFHEKQPNPNSIYMIWPEFEDKSQIVITDTSQSVNSTGTARMWIMNPKMRKFHQELLKVGMTGYFMEGGWRVAECEIIEILGLLINPTDEK